MIKLTPTQWSEIVRRACETVEADGDFGEGEQISQREFFAAMRAEMRGELDTHREDSANLAPRGWDVGGWGDRD